MKFINVNTECKIVMWKLVLSFLLKRHIIYSMYIYSTILKIYTSRDIKMSKPASPWRRCWIQVEGTLWELNQCERSQQSCRSCRVPSEVLASSYHSWMLTTSTWQKHRGTTLTSSQLREEMRVKQVNKYSEGNEQQTMLEAIPQPRVISLPWDPAPSILPGPWAEFKQTLRGQDIQRQKCGTFY